jgi:hypothetical protein
MLDFRILIWTQAAIPRSRIYDKISAANHRPEGRLSLLEALVATSTWREILACSETQRMMERLVRLG